MVEKKKCIYLFVLILNEITQTNIEKNKVCVGSKYILDRTNIRIGNRGGEKKNWKRERERIKVTVSKKRRVT